MKSMTVAVLVGAATAIGVAAWLVDRAGRPISGSAETTNDRVVPGLTARVNDVASITLKKPAAEFTVARKDGQWGLESKGGYPVKVEDVKGLIVGLAELRPVEPKTSKPENYSKIGVQDPDAPAGTPTPPKPNPQSPEDFTPPPPTPTLITLKDSSGAVLASTIIGTQKWGNPPEVYVRKAGDQQSWLAQGRLEVPTDAMGLLDRQIINIGRERVKSATVTHPDGQTVTVTKDTTADPNFKVQGIPAGREPSNPNAGETIGSALSYLSIDDVAPADQIDFSGQGVTPGASAEYHTFDGLTVRVHTATKEDKTWALFETSYTAPPAPPAPATPPATTEPGATPPAPGDAATQPAQPAAPPAATEAAANAEKDRAEAVKKEAADLGTKLSKWAFVVPQYKAKAFQTKLEDLLKPLAPPAPPAADPSAPAGPQPQPAPAAPPPPPPGG